MLIFTTRYKPPFENLRGYLEKQQMTANKICLVEFHRPNIKLPTFSEITGALLSAFNQMGIEARFKENQIDANALNIIFGCHRLFQSFEKLDAFPENCIFFNLEPLNGGSKDASHLRYLDLLKHARVIDYSDRNCKLLAGEPGNRTYRFKFGYAPLTPFKFPSKGDHLLFYGVPSERRKAVVNSLLKKDIQLSAIVSYWGFERDYEICTSRAVLNIGKEANNILEVYRLWHSLCLGTPVITEKGIDRVLVGEWEKYVHFIEDPQQISGKTAEMAPSADIYKTETSFLSECIQLYKWIQEAAS